MSRLPRAVHEHGMRVYWEDTDAGGIVFYANYLKFFERARTEWLRGLGFSQEQLRTAGPLDDAAMFVVTETALRWRQPARLDDWLLIDVWVQETSGASLRLQQHARRDGQLLCEGDIRIACVTPGTLKPRRIPKALMQSLDPR